MSSSSSHGGMNTTNVAVVTGCLGGVLLLMIVGLIFLLREKGWCCFRSNQRRAQTSSKAVPDSTKEERGELRLIEGTEHEAAEKRGSPLGPNSSVPRNSRLISHSARRRELERANSLHYEAAAGVGVPVAGGQNGNLSGPPSGPFYGSQPTPSALQPAGPTSLLDMAAAAASNTQPLAAPGSGPLGLQPLALNCLQVSQVPSDHYLPAPDMGDLTRGAALSIVAWRDDVAEVMQRISASGEPLVSPVPGDPWYDQHLTGTQSPRPSDARSETMSVASSQDPYYAGLAGQIRSPVVSDLSDVHVKPLLVAKQPTRLVELGNEGTEDDKKDDEEKKGLSEKQDDVDAGLDFKKDADSITLIQPSGAEDI